MKIIKPSRELLLPTRRAFLAGAAGAIAAPAIVRAQNIIGGGIWGDVKVSGGTYTPQTPQYVGLAGASGAGSSTFSASGVSIGNPAFIATRRVYVIVAGLWGTSGTGITSATIGASAATVHYDVTETASNNRVAAFSAVVASGTTATITVNLAATNFGGPEFFVYYFDNSLLSSTTPAVGTNTTTTGTSLSATYSETINGFVIASFWCDSAATGATYGGSYVDDQPFGSVKGLMSHLAPVASTGTGTTTLTWTGSASVAMGVAQWH